VQVVLDLPLAQTFGVAERAEDELIERVDICSYCVDEFLRLLDLPLCGEIVDLSAFPFSSRYEFGILKVLHKVCGAEYYVCALESFGYGWGVVDVSDHHVHNAV
jgi:hypothetical protein